MAKNAYPSFWATGMILFVLPAGYDGKMTASGENVCPALRNQELREDSSLMRAESDMGFCIYFGSYPLTETCDKKGKTVVFYGKNLGRNRRLWRLMQKPMPKLTSQTNWGTVMGCGVIG